MFEIKEEKYREYVTKDGYIYRINEAKRLVISSSGTHYITDIKGVTHTIKADAFMVMRIFGPLEFINPSASEGED